MSFRGALRLGLYRAQCVAGLHGPLPYNLRSLLEDASIDSIVMGQGDAAGFIFDIPEGSGGEDFRIEAEN